MYQIIQISGSNLKLGGYVWDVSYPKRVMCIIHGIGEHSGRYDRMAMMLNNSGIAVVSIDLPGHGISGGKRGHTAPRDKIIKCVDLMIEKTTELYPGIPLTLFGHSMGGALCLDYRARGTLNNIPDRYLVTSPWLKLVKEIPKPVIEAARIASKVLPLIAISSGCEAEDLGNIALTKSYETDPLVHRQITIKTAVECTNIAEEILSGKILDNKRAKGKPFLLMHGDEDKICDVEGSRQLAARLEKEKNFAYIEWEGYYHEIFNGGPEATGEKPIETIRDFVLS